jgi:putative oxidoreductase
MSSLAHRCRRLVSEDWHAWYAIPLRLAVGFGFIEHGYAKIIHDPAVFVGILHALQVPAPVILGWATILVELFGGAAVLFGVFIPLATVPMAVVLLVPILTVHLPNGFSSIKLLSVDGAGAHFGQPGYETDLLYLAGLAALVLGGSGPFALDTVLLNARRRPTH